MKKLRVDKIASVTVNLGLSKTVEVSDRISARQGAVCVVRALEEKRVYDKLELSSGRMAKISRGDIIVGALGKRRALMGFCGVVPESVKTGDTLNILNIGGVIGKATSYNRDYGLPLKVEVLGAACREGTPLNIADHARPVASTLRSSMPIVVVSGTSMNSGKTVAASKIVQELTWKGYTVAAAKVSGVSALKDTLNMMDHGAVEALSFLDFGYPSTVGSEDVPRITKGALNALSESDPDVCVVELGDGILGDYGVKTFFSDREIASAISCNIVCAIDPVGAWGITEILRKEGIGVDLVSGPITDNTVGIDFIRNNLGCTGINAVDGKKLGDFVQRRIGEKS
ncbi:MAG: hypothetical protein JXQ30_02185 [Spirochaetes bacterium]|nr:hypothetical protein [Spirochaetota bacterium]